MFELASKNLNVNENLRKVINTSVNNDKMSINIIHIMIYKSSSTYPHSILQLLFYIYVI